MVTKKHRFLQTIIVLIMTAALALMGTVSSFAEEITYEGAGDVPDTTATSVIVMDAGSGEVLYEKNAHKKRDPASVTKILNLLVCLDVLDPNQEVTVEIDPETEGSIMDLRKGEKISIRDLMYGMMLWSANDAAEYLGYLAGDGDIDAFCNMMDAKAKSLGAEVTDYVNPNGLNPNKVNNVTSAYDIALMVREGMKNELFREIVGTREYTINKTNKSKKRKMTNSNKCLWDKDIQAAADGEKEALDKYTEEYANDPFNYIPEDEGELRQVAQSAAVVTASLMYKPCIGVKTGYTSTAGDCFAGFAKKGKTEIIAVVLNAPHSRDKFKDAKKLWKYAFANFKTYTAEKSDKVLYEQKVRRGDLSKVDLGIAEDFRITVLKDTRPSETITTEMKLPEEKPTAPIKKGTVLGQLVAYDNGEEIASTDLITLEKVEKGGPLSYIGIADEQLPEFIIITVLALITLFIIFVVLIPMQKRKKRKARKARGENPGRGGRVERSNERARREENDAADRSKREERRARRKRRKNRRRRRTSQED